MFMLCFQKIIWNDSHDDFFLQGAVYVNYQRIDSIICDQTYNYLHFIHVGNDTFFFYGDLNEAKFYNFR